MKHDVTLYEFMPYGAPELLESRKRHMSQALILTCASMLAACALAGGIASLIPATRSVPLPLVFQPDNYTVRPHESAPPPLLPRAPHVTRPRVEDAVPVPIPDALAHPDEAPPSPIVDDSGSGPVGTTIPNDGVGVTGGEPALPLPGEYVYVETLPTVVKRVVPVYPQIAKDAGVEGLVMVNVLVGKDGRVLDARLVEKFQVPMLNGAALMAAGAWVFTPGLADGRAVACWTAIPFRFRLH